MITRRFGLLFVVALSAFLFAQLSYSQRDLLPAGLQDALTEQALRFLRNEYNVMVTGTPPGERLVPRLIGMARVEVSGEERVTALLKARESSLQHGKRHTAIEVTLNPVGIVERDGKVILHAVDKVIEHFTFDPAPSPSVPSAYEESTRHDFIFSVTSRSTNTSRNPFSVQVGDFEYTLTKDITEPQLLNVSQDEDQGQGYSRPGAIPLKETPPVDKQQKRRKP